MKTASLTRARWACSLLIVFVVVFCVFSPSGAQKKKPLKTGPEGAPYEGYPLVFDGEGIIDRIDKDFVVINDSQWPLAGNATFNRPNALGRGASALKQGDYVGYVTDGKGRVKSLWWLETR